MSDPDGTPPPKVTISHVDPGGVFSEVTMEGATIIGTVGKPGLRIAKQHLDKGRWTDAIREAQTPCELYAKQLMWRVLERDPQVSDVAAELRKRHVRSWMLHPGNKNLRRLYEDLTGKSAASLPGWSDGRLTRCVEHRDGAAHRGAQFGEVDAREVLSLFDQLVAQLEADFANV